MDESENWARIILVILYTPVSEDMDESESVERIM